MNSTNILLVLGFMFAIIFIGYLVWKKKNQKYKRDSYFYGVRHCEKNQTEGCVDCQCDGTCPNYNK